MKKAKMEIVMVLVMLGVIGWGFSSSYADERPVKIGALGPFTGAHVSYGDQEKFGIVAAVEKINAQGGVNGHKIEIFWADDKGAIAEDVTGCQRLVHKDEVLAVIGPITSGGTLASMKVTERAKVPHVASSGAHVSITKQGNKWIFRNSISDFYQSSLLAQGLIEIGYKRVAVFNDSEEYGKGGAENLEKRYKALTGKDLVAREVHERKELDYKGQLLRIKEANPDMVVLWTAGYDAAKIIKQAREMGMKYDFAGPTALATPDVIPLLGKDAENLVVIAAWIPSLEDPASVAFREIVHQRFRKEVPADYVIHFPDTHAAQFYDGIHILVEAMKKSNLSFDPKNLDAERIKLRDALEKTDYQGITGHITCTPEDHDMLKSALISKVNGGQKMFVRRVTF